MNKYLQLKTIALIFAIIFLSACQSIPEEVPEGLSQQEYFQHAQGYADTKNWKAALLYLEQFQTYFPDATANIQAANYQIGLIRYKQKDYDLAKEQLLAISQVYENDESGKLLQWVEVLSNKLLKKISDIQSKKSRPKKRRAAK